MTCGYIYKIEFPNGKHYIGLTTTSIEQRRGEHKYRTKRGDKQYLYNAIRKYEMVDTFELIEIDTAETIEELCEKEIQYIQEYNSYYLNKNGYNMTFGGDCGNGYIYTEEDNRKNSERQKKYHEDNPEARQKYSEMWVKYWGNVEARQKQSERTKNYYKKNPEAGKEHGEVMNEYYKKNPEARQQASERTKNHYKDNPETRKKILDTKGQNKPFDIFTIEGTFVKTFCYQFEARDYLQKEYHITSSIKTGDVLAGRKKSSAGFVFKYK